MPPPNMKCTPSKNLVAFRRDLLIKSPFRAPTRSTGNPTLLFCMMLGLWVIQYHKFTQSLSNDFLRSLIIDGSSSGFYNLSASPCFFLTIQGQRSSVWLNEAGNNSASPNCRVAPPGPERTSPRSGMSPPKLCVVLTATGKPKSCLAFGSKLASMEQLKLMGPIILSGVLKFLDGQASTEAEISLRELKAFAYQAIGQLAQRVPQLFRGNVEMAARLFQALKKEDSSIRFTVQEAVNSLATAYKDRSALVSKDLEALLLENSQVVESEARFCAVRWATLLYDIDHCPSRFICMLAAADNKLDIREMALEGLSPAKQDDRIVNHSSPAVPEKYPPLKEMLDYICQHQPKVLEITEVGERKLLFPAKMYVAMIRFLQKCYEAEYRKSLADGRGEMPHYLPSLSSLCLLLEHAMAYEGSVELHGTASKALLVIASQNPEVIASRYAEHLPWLKQFLGHIDSDTRESVSRLLGITCSALSTSSASTLIHELCSTLKVSSKGRLVETSYATYPILILLIPENWHCGFTYNQSLVFSSGLFHTADSRIVLEQPVLPDMYWLSA
eukprot:Gb_39352 [translate_table: standard]